MAVQDALRERDTARLRESAHKFCGMIAAFPPWPVVQRLTSKTMQQVASSKRQQLVVEQLATMGRELSAPRRQSVHRLPCADCQRLPKDH